MHPWLTLLFKHCIHLVKTLVPNTSPKLISCRLRLCPIYLDVDIVNSYIHTYSFVYTKLCACIYELTISDIFRPTLITNIILCQDVLFSHTHTHRSRLRVVFTHYTVETGSCLFTYHTVCRL